jgi:hypothetical protein
MDKPLLVGRGHNPHRQAKTNNHHSEESTVQTIIDILSTAYTPDGGIADPNHPVYALLWALKLIAGS